MSKEDENLEPKPAGDGGRDNKGRFAPGNKAGKGNPLHRRMAAFRSEIVRTMTREKIAKMIESLYQGACAGDVQAATLVLKYAVGNPVDVSKSDSESVEQSRVVFIPVMQRGSS